MGSIIGLDGKALAMDGQAYEGATRSPRGYGWAAPNIGPNTAVAAAGATLRNRSRAGYRNSPLLRSAINKAVTSEVGKGSTVSSQCADLDVRKQLNALWKVHQNQLDPWGDMSFGQILSQAVRARKTAGEVFIRRVPISQAWGIKVPFQIQVLEAEFCPLGLNRRLSGNRRIVSGVEFVGRKKAAFWFHLQHPGEGQTFETDRLVRVPARDVIHHFNPIRPGQIRGEPDTGAALLKDREFADYSDAELTRKKTRSAFTGFLYREEFGEEDFDFDPMTGQKLFDDEDGDASPPAPETDQPMSVQAGTVLRGRPGDKMQMFEGDNTGSGFKDFVKWQALQLAAALDIPYPLLTGDWEGLSDRTIRAVMNEYRRGVTADQANLLGFQLCLGVWKWFVNACVLNGLVSAPGFASDPWKFYNLDIRHDAWRHLQPEQDIRSRSMAVASNLSNYEREAAECGGDVEENIKANIRVVKAWRAACEAEGLDPDKLGVFKPAQQETEKETDE